MAENKNIEVGGRLHSIATGNVLAGANEILDDVKGKKQSEINAELIEAVGTGGSVDSRIAAAKEEIKGTATSACDTLGKAETKINANTADISNETIRAQAAESTLNTEKADKGTTLYDYGITNAYTKTEVDERVSTPHQNYVTVATKADLDAIVTGGTAAEDTIYRVSSYDFTANNNVGAVDVTKYSEYAYTGSAMVPLTVKSQIGEVFDVSAYHSGETYANLNYVLSNNKIPADVRRGGMSVKFVQSSDNNYVQYRLMKDGWSINVKDWYNVEQVAQELDIQINGSTVDLSNLTEYKGLIESNGKWNIYSQSSSALSKFVLLPVTPTESFVLTNNSLGTVQFAFVKESVPGVSSTSVNFAEGVTGRTSLEQNKSVTVTAPEDAVSLYIRKTNTSGDNILPDVVNVSDSTLYRAVENLTELSFNKIPYKIFDGAILVSNGTIYSNENRMHTEYIDISNISKLFYTRACTTGSESTFGMAFYDINKQFISGVREILSAQKEGYVIHTVDVPQSAVYARFTYWKDTKRGIFFIADAERDAFAIEILNTHESFLNTHESVANLNHLVDTLDTQINDDNQVIDLSGLPVYKAMIPESGKWYPDQNSNTECVFLPVVPSQTFTLTNNNEQNSSQFAFIKESIPGNYKSDVKFATGVSGRTTLLSGESVTVIAPIDAVTLYIRKTNTEGGNMLPLVEKEGNGLDKRVTSLEEAINDDEKLFEELAVSFDLSPYIVSGYHINTEQDEWLHTQTSNCYLIPVNKGQTFFMKSPESIFIYWAFLIDNTTIGVPNYVSGTTLNRSNDAVNFTKVVIPEGTNYLYVNKNTLSSTDHTPIIKSISNSNNEEELVTGTFNSSYNIINTETIRNKFCGLIKGKNTIETFMFFSDPHLTDNDRYQTIDEFARDKYVSALQKYYNSLPLDSCICGGDWLNFSHTDNEACGFLGYCDSYMRKLFKNYLPTFGNHDNNPYQDGSGQQSGWVKALSYIDIRNLMFRQEGETWYSSDGINTKYYVLNTGVSFIKTMTDSNYNQLVNNRWEQVDWFANKLLIDDAEHSVVVMHIFSNASVPSDWDSQATGYWANGVHYFARYIRQVAEAYNNRSSITLNGNTYNFTNKTGKVVFILTGHTHFDYVDTKSQIPVVCITNLAGGYMDGTVRKMALTPTFDNCLIDFDNQRLYMIRVGAAHSRIVNYIPQDVVTNGTIALTSQLTGALTWQSVNTSIATVSEGIVSGVTSGCIGIIATDENGEEEYWIIKVS